MRKFMTLLKKEIRELLTLQMLLPIVIGFLAFALIGNIVGSENKRAQKEQKISVLDLDNTRESQAVITALKENQFKVSPFRDQSIDTVVKNAKAANIPIVLSIPQGFGKGIKEFHPLPIESYSIIRNFSTSGSLSIRSLESAHEALNLYFSKEMIKNKISTGNVDAEAFRNPIQRNDIVVVGDKSGKISPDKVISFITSQTTFIPIIMFLVIVMSAQMIGVAIASEKENKTLETLLSTPISRTSLVTAKMAAAGIVSLLLAFVYMIGFGYFVSGMAGDTLKEAVNSGSNEAIRQLGLTLDITGYVLIGTSLFFSILIALAISIILGAFAEDVKKAQGMLAPITIFIMIPYILALVIDMESASPLVKYMVYAIPFSHPFLAAPNIFLHKYTTVFGGIAYEAMVFFIFVFIATRIFSSDKILTMKLSFRKRK